MLLPEDAISDAYSGPAFVPRSTKSCRNCRLAKAAGVSPASIHNGSRIPAREAASAQRLRSLGSILSNRIA